VLAEWEPSLGEMELLTEVCRGLDVADALAAALAAEGVTTLGSKNQLRVNPVVQALNATRALLSRQLAQLDLPALDDVALPSPRSVQAQRAAKSRWAGHTPRTGRAS
jgi:hypothetical protein